MSLSGSSTGLKLGFLILCVSLLLHIVGFSTTSWAVGKYAVSRYTGRFSNRYKQEVSVGLWRTCLGETCYKQRGAQSWFQAIQALECLGLIGMVISVAITGSIIMYSGDHRTSKLHKYKYIGPMFTALAITIGIIIFLTKYIASSTLITVGYSVGLSSAASTGAFVVAFIFCCCGGPPETPGQGDPTTAVQPPNQSGRNDPFQSGGGYGGYVIQPPPQAFATPSAPPQYSTDKSSQPVAYPQPVTYPQPVINPPAPVASPLPPTYDSTTK